MNLNVFTPIDMDNIARMSFIEKTIPFVIKENGGPFYLGAAHLLSKDSLDKLGTHMAGKVYDIKAGDKVYVFPKCKIPKFKIKEYLRSIGATLTGEYENATVYLGTKSACEAYSYGNEETFNTLVADPKDDLYKMVPHLDNINFMNEMVEPLYPELYNDPERVGFLASAFVTLNDAGDATQVPFKKGILYPLGASILFNILAKQIPVVSEDHVYNSIPSTFVIDEEMFNSFNDMLASQDISNREIAIQTIANCNIEKSKHYLYVLARRYHNIFTYSRLKNVKLFMDESNFNKLATTPLHQFIREYLQNGSAEDFPRAIFNKLLSDEAETIVEEHGIDKIQSGMFDIVLVPKKEFAALHENTTFTYKLDPPPVEND